MIFRHNPVNQLQSTSNGMGSSVPRLEADHAQVSSLSRANRTLKISCPCCKNATLSERGAFETCVACEWIDTGQDDHNADAKIPGPNPKSLTEARRLFFEKIWDRAVREKQKQTPPSSPFPSTSPPPPYHAPADSLQFRAPVESRAFDSPGASHQGLHATQTETRALVRVSSFDSAEVPVPDARTRASTFGGEDILQSSAEVPSHDVLGRRRSAVLGKGLCAVINYANGHTHHYDALSFTCKRFGYKYFLRPWRARAHARAR